MGLEPSAAQLRYVHPTTVFQLSLCLLYTDDKSGKSREPQLLTSADVEEKGIFSMDIADCERVVTGGKV